MKISWRTEWPMWLLLIGMFAVAAASWGATPDRLPVHWNLSGQPDRWGGRFEGLMVMPLVSLVIYLIMLFLPRIDPGRANYANFGSTYYTLRLLVLLLTATIQACVVLAARGYAVDMNTVMPLIIGATFVLIGNLFGKLRPTWFVGIRTPWTLSSKESWMRTHRAGGPLFIAFGVLFMATALFHTPWMFPAALGLSMIGVLGLIVYSYTVWKNDPEKMPPAGTTPAA